ncbi:MAG: hypothetical protein J2P35_09480 [Actinobacteria bacterium]|nr:hypothetical protein [Actinomycetota bacterium]
MVYRERAGDDVKCRIRQVQVLRNAHHEGHSRACSALRVRDGRHGRVHSGDLTARPGRGSQLPREKPAARTHIQDRISRPHPAQRDNPLVHAAAAPAERELAHHLVQAEAVDRGTRAAPPGVQATERVVHGNLRE